MGNGLSDYRQEDMLSIVMKLAEQYVSGDSTSITYERAQSLMDAVLYCINEYEHADDGNFVRAEMTAGEVYELGFRLVQDKARKVRENYHRLMAGFDDYGMECLRDTVAKGIPGFLKRYDVRFAPQETLLTLDYPILRDIRELSGVDAVFEYIRCIEWEQQLLGRFDRYYVREILRRYHLDYEHLFENICHIVMMNLTGHVLLHKPLAEQGFTGDELRKLGLIFTELTEEEAEKTIDGYIRSLMERYCKENLLLYKYLQGDVHAMAVRIRSGVSVGHPEKIFLL